MQYGFSYFYYLMNARKPFDLEQFLEEEVDLDKSKTISFSELRVLMQLLAGKTPVTRNAVIEMSASLKNITVSYDLAHALRI